jgi:Family of unknown function (DUF5343)
VEAKMARDIPYMVNAKNLNAILEKIKIAQTPPKFTHEFLKAHLGFPSSNDRSIIQVLKSLGFLGADSQPTPRYNEFRSEETCRLAMASGLQDGWSDIFLADQNAHRRSVSDLVEIFKNVTGKSEAVATKMATTFGILSKYAEFSAQPKATLREEKPQAKNDAPLPIEKIVRELNLRNDIHIHLPATSDVAVYTAIFRALREELLD